MQCPLCNTVLKRYCAIWGVILIWSAKLFGDFHIFFSFQLLSRCVIKRVPLLRRMSEPQPPLLLKNVSQYTQYAPICIAVLLVPLRFEEREILSVLLPFVSQYASHSYRNLSGLVAGDSAICGRLAALILRLRPAGLRFEEFRSSVKRGGLGLRFSNRSGLRPAAI